MNTANIYGRDAELKQLQKLVSRRKSFLLYGPAGAGKTLLVKALIAQIDGLLYCEESSSSQGVFRKLAAELFAKKDGCIVQACGRGGSSAINCKSAVSIRGIVSEALRGGDHWIVLDHLKSPSQSFATALKDVSGWTETPLIAVARSAHMEDVGFLLPMFCEPSDKCQLRNFDPNTARRFALEIAGEMQLQAANRDDVIERIVRYSKGNPGAIRTMLQMAAGPKYVAQKHVKISPLYIDFRLRSGASHG
jgi:hypothetical protein